MHIIPTSEYNKPLNFVAKELVEAANFILDQDGGRAAHVAAFRLTKNAVLLYPGIRHDIAFGRWAVRFGKTLRIETRKQVEELTEVLIEVERGHAPDKGHPFHFE